MRERWHSHIEPIPAAVATRRRRATIADARFAIFRIALTLSLIGGLAAVEAPTTANPLGPKVEANKTPPRPPPSAEAPGTKAPAEEVMVENCDGTRTKSEADARTLTCEGWKVEWREGGSVWGYVSGSSYDAVIKERDRQLGFARQYARFFEQPFDDRYADPSQPVCDMCKEERPAGRWGDGQKFGAGTAREAIDKAQADLEALDKALMEHLPRLRDVAGLAREAGVDKAAKAHADQIRLGMLDLAKGQLSIDNAEVFRSARSAKKVSELAASRSTDLGNSYAALLAAVGKEVGKVHGGKYFEDNTTGQRPYLQVDFDGSKVTATYVVGTARSTWFNGEVALDGAITGKSLVAPEATPLTCQEHSEECGFVYVPAVLRFSERKAPDQKVSAAAELWFQQSKWVLAKPFSR